MTKVYNMLFLGIIAVIVVSTTADYCNLKRCDQSGTHTMCMYPSPGPASACLQWSSAGLSNQEKNAIVDKHNKLRQFVASGRERRGINGPQPAAVSMPNLSWDDELATIAQRWADQCNYGHDKCGHVARYRVGQNIAESSSTGQNTRTPEDMIQMWYDEVAKFNNREINNFQTVNGVGHYTQIVWAKTTKIGCGRIKYKEGKWNEHYLVCNYGPAGNWYGEKIYDAKW